MENYVHNKLQELELLILEEIDRICLKHSIVYFLGYGTLIGAVRHGGFIPWDDDIDLFMPRDDYERFLEVCQTELDERFLLHFQETDLHYPLSMTKIRLKDTVFLEKDVRSDMISHGIWVDIFVLDEVKQKNSFLQRTQFKMVACMNTIKGVRLGWNNLKGCSLFTKSLYVLLRILSVKQIYLIQERIRKLYRGGACKYMMEFSGCYGSYKQTFLKEDLFPPKRTQFSNITCYVPQSAHNILTGIYGENYMTLPPPEDRRTHNPLKLDFGPYGD